MGEAYQQPLTPTRRNLQERDRIILQTMKSAGRTIFRSILLCAPLLSVCQANGQKSAPVCGQDHVELDGATYLTVAGRILAVKLPAPWRMDHQEDGAFYFLKSTDTFESARTLMYINVQQLDGTLSKAVQRDEEESKHSCPTLRIRALSTLPILEKSCGHVTQKFDCTRSRHPHVDLVTKIAIGDLLLNVVLSSESDETVGKNAADYGYVLEHTALVH